MMTAGGEGGDEDGGGDASELTLRLGDEGGDSTRMGLLRLW